MLGGLKARGEIAHGAVRSGLDGEQKVKEQKGGNANASMCNTETIIIRSGVSGKYLFN